MYEHPELMVKVGATLTIAAAAAPIVSTDPVTQIEVAAAFLGGFLGGVPLARMAAPRVNQSWTDLGYTVLLSAVWGGSIGPILAKHLDAAYLWIGDGFFEDLFCGLAVGAISPPVFGLFVMTLRFGQEHPDKIPDLIRRIWKRE